MTVWEPVDFRGHGYIDMYVSFNGPPVDRHTIALASLCELSRPQGEPLDFPHLGAASMEVRNIVPRDDDTIVFRCEIDWDDDLDLRLSIVTF